MATVKIKNITNRNGELILEYLEGINKGSCSAKVPQNFVWDQLVECKGKTVSIETDGKKLLNMVDLDGLVIFTAIQNGGYAKRSPAKTDSARSKRTKSSPISNQEPKAETSKTNQPDKERAEPEAAQDKEGNQHAKAPYNFVPINLVVVPAPSSDGGQETLNGYLDLEVMALTPVYIRGSDAKSSKFFNPGDVTSIPGSSLRGMVRSLVEIVAWARMEYIDDRRLHYRNFDAQSRYTGRMIQNRRYRGSAGLLFRDKNGVYRIQPLDQEILQYSARPTADDPIKWKVKHGESTSDVDQFTVKRVRFALSNRGLAGAGQNQGAGDLVNDLCFIEDCDSSQNDGNHALAEGWLILSGAFGKGHKKRHKHRHRLVRENPYRDNSPPKTEVPDEVITNYRKDWGRTDSVNILNQADSSDTGVPCFYLVNQGNKNDITAIGHTPFFRLPYKRLISEHLPASHREANQKPGSYDIAQMIFGCSGKLAGRVYFEDARLQSEDIACDPKSLRILSEPKPTYTPHYLQQPTGQGAKRIDWEDTIRNEDGTGLIRGYKLYWHRQTADRPTDSEPAEYSWAEREIKEDAVHAHPVEALKPGACFQGRIRFENLSPIELGALLFVLELPEGLNHKIGLGKPLGLGSVNLKPSLNLCHRGERYGKLFTEGGAGWEEGLKRETNTGLYKDCFAAYILGQLEKEKSKSDLPSDWIRPQEITAEHLWDVPRMRSLHAMLNMQGTLGSDDKPRVEWLEATRYMRIPEKRGGINEFENKPSLPDPVTVMENAGCKPSRQLSDES